MSRIQLYQRVKEHKERITLAATKQGTLPSDIYRDFKQDLESAKVNLIARARNALCKGLSLSQL